MYIKYHILPLKSKILKNTKTNKNYSNSLIKVTFCKKIEMCVCGKEIHLEK